MIRLDAATVLLQWATGGLAFLWVTTRHRQVGLGYGWLLRIVYGLMAAGALAVGLWVDPVPVRDGAAALVVLATGVALVSSVRRRAAGVEGQRDQVEVRSARVAAMTGIERSGDAAEFDGPFLQERYRRQKMFCPIAYHVLCLRVTLQSER